MTDNPRDRAALAARLRLMRANITYAFPPVKDQRFASLVDALQSATEAPAEAQDKKPRPGRRR